MKQVILNGFLGDKYGREWNIKANNFGKILQCIECNYPSFRKDLIDFAESGGDLSIMYGDRVLEDEEELFYSIGEDTVVVTPLPAGAKGGGAKLLLAGLIVASFFIPGSTALLVNPATFGSAAMGGTLTASTAAGSLALGGTLNWAGLALAGLATNLALTGLQQIMAPDPSVDEPATNDDYLFDGAQNTVAQNNVVPVLFGRMIVGGVLISSATVAGNVTQYTYGFTYNNRSYAAGANTGALPSAIGDTLYPSLAISTDWSFAQNTTRALL